MLFISGELVKCFKYKTGKMFQARNRATRLFFSATRKKTKSNFTEKNHFKKSNYDLL